MRKRLTVNKRWRDKKSSGAICKESTGKALAEGQYFLAERAEELKSISKMLQVLYDSLKNSEPSTDNRER